MVPTTSQSRVVLITDRGGHWQNARMLFEQMQRVPDWVVTTQGPEVPSLRASGLNVVVIPYLFTWLGKKRVLNPLKVAYQFLRSAFLVIRLRPTHVISLGATDVVFFCYLSWCLGARVFHVECMNQVVSPSVCGRMLYPICQKLYVQWPELLGAYGPKAQYAGWVVSGAA